MSLHYGDQVVVNSKHGGQSNWRLYPLSVARWTEKSDGAAEAGQRSKRANGCSNAKDVRNMAAPGYLWPWKCRSVFCIGCSAKQGAIGVARLEWCGGCKGVCQNASSRILESSFFLSDWRKGRQYGRELQSSGREVIWLWTRIATVGSVRDGSSWVVLTECVIEKPVCCWGWHPDS